MILKMITVTSKDELRKILKKNKKIIIIYGKEDCSACDNAKRKLNSCKGNFLSVFVDCDKIKTIYVEFPIIKSYYNGKRLDTSDNIDYLVSNLKLRP